MRLPTCPCSGVPCGDEETSRERTRERPHARAGRETRTGGVCRLQSLLCLSAVVPLLLLVPSILRTSAATCTLTPPFPPHVKLGTCANVTAGSACRPTCDPGYLPTRFLVCQPDGNFTLLSDPICAPLQAGAFLAPDGRQLPCPRGTYCPQASRQPTVCPPSRSTQQTRSTNISDCNIACPNGFVCDGINIKYPCPPGRYSNATGAESNSTCKECTGSQACPGGDQRFECSSGSYTSLLVKQSAASASPFAQQGWSVSLSSDGRTAAVGAPNDGTNFSGIVRIYIAHNGVWSQQAALRGTDETNTNLGVSVALSADGNDLLVGGYAIINASNHGCAVFFHRASNGTWSQTNLVGVSYESVLVVSSADGNVAVLTSNSAALIMTEVLLLTRTGGVWSDGVLLHVNPGEFVGPTVSASFQSTSVSRDGSRIVVGFVPLRNRTTSSIVFLTRTWSLSTNGSCVQDTQDILSIVDTTMYAYVPLMMLSVDGASMYTIAEGALITSTRSSDGSSWVANTPLDLHLPFHLLSDASISDDGQTLALSDILGATYIVQRQVGGTWLLRFTMIGADALFFFTSNSNALSADGNVLIVGSQDDGYQRGAAWMGPWNGCSSCPPGFLCPTTGIEPCPDGSYCVNNQATYCDAGRWSDNRTEASSANACFSCPLGGACADGVLVACPRGTYDSVGGLTSISQCHSCDAGTASSVMGAITPTTCQTCVEPQYAKDAKQSECAVCRTGSQWHSATECAQCESLGCDGSSSCDVGYLGELCVDCLGGYYHPVDSSSSDAECRPCSATAPWVPPVFIMVTLVIVALVAKLNSSPLIRAVSTPLDVGLSHVQIIGFMHLIAFQWPSSAKAPLSIFGLTLFDPRTLVESACFISFETAFKLKLILPLIVCGLLAIAWMVYRWATQNGTYFSSLRRSITSAFVGLDVRTTSDATLLVTRGVVSFLTFAYIYLASESVTIFNCVRFGASTLRVQAAPEIECHSHAWYAYLAPSVLGIAVYIIGIPSLLLSIGRSSHAFSSRLWSTIDLRHRWWWSAFDLGWKLSVACIFRLMMSDTTAQISIFGVLILVRLVVVALAFPFADDLLNHEELALGVASLVVFICGVIFYSTTPSFSDGGVKFFVATAWISLLCMLCVTVRCMLAEYRRHQTTVKKAITDTVPYVHGTQMTAVEDSSEHATSDGASHVAQPLSPLSVDSASDAECVPARTHADASQHEIELADITEERS